jgi:hypothetical protein
MTLLERVRLGAKRRIGLQSTTSPYVSLSTKEKRIREAIDIADWRDEEADLGLGLSDADIESGNGFMPLVSPSTGFEEIEQEESKSEIIHLLKQINLSEKEWQMILMALSDLHDQSKIITIMASEWKVSRQRSSQIFINMQKKIKAALEKKARLDLFDKEGKIPFNHINIYETKHQREAREKDALLLGKKTVHETPDIEAIEKRVDELIKDKAVADLEREIKKPRSNKTKDNKTETKIKTEVSLQIAVKEKAEKKEKVIVEEKQEKPLRAHPKHLAFLKSLGFDTRAVFVIVSLTGRMLSDEAVSYPLIAKLLSNVSDEDLIAFCKKKKISQLKAKEVVQAAIKAYRNI